MDLEIRTVNLFQLIFYFISFWTGAQLSIWTKIVDTQWFSGRKRWKGENCYWWISATDNINQDDFEPCFCSGLREKKWHVHPQVRALATYVGFHHISCEYKNSRYPSFLFLKYMKNVLTHLIFIEIGSCVSTWSSSISSSSSTAKHKQVSTRIA